MKNILFSYNISDGHKVFRIYDDLVRSGFSTWRFEVDGVKGEQFEAHYKNLLENETDVFIYCDSSKARKSAFVARECQWAFEAIEDNNLRLSEILVCIFEPSKGGWRIPSAYPESQEMWKKINAINSFKFLEHDIEGESYVYFSEMEKLAERLGGSFLPWSSIPRDKDFEQELQAARNEAVPLIHREALLFGYRYLRVSSNEKWEGTLAKWDQFVNDCKTIFAR